MNRVAEIVINRSANKLNRKLVYHIPDSLGEVPVGTRVFVPLRNGNEEGIIVNYVDTTLHKLEWGQKKIILHDYDGKDEITLRSIYKVLDKDPWFTDEMLKTAQKIRDYFICPYGEALALFTINKKIKKGYARPTEKILRIDKRVEPSNLKRKKVQAQVVSHLESYGPTRVKDLEALGFTKSLLKQVTTLPEIIVEEVPKETRTIYGKLDSLSKTIPFTDAQRAVYGEIEKSIVAGRKDTFLLHGVTGSGKTQVYIRSVQECLRQGKSAIVLVPEISLTYQIVKRFVEVFGDEVVVFHSGLTIDERYNNWERLKRGDSHIIIGARSAVFAPLSNIGIIILDEEHDHSYKDWDNSHYHARTVAAFRSEAHSCPLLLGSATPSMTSYYKAMEGEYKLLEMTERIHQQEMPLVSIIDMKEEMFYGNYSVLSGALENLIEETLDKKEQLILLLNRRGYSTFILCRSCGKPVECPHCDTSLIYHKSFQNLRCHYCDHSEPVPKVCPHCGSEKIKFFGSGTQKVEEILQKKFPHARIARVDQDMKQQKGLSDKIFDAFSKGDYDILLGTQMVSKGHDFPNVSAVGVITADSSLNISNYSAAEQTFNLLTQTAGRAGRGNSKGKVIIQTYDPSHYAIINSKTHNFKEFYEVEIKFRKALSYPPFDEMMHIMISLPDKDKAEVTAKDIAKDLREKFSIERELCQVAGPYEEVINKVRDKYRFSIMVKGKDISEIKKYIYDSWIFTVDGFSINVDPL